MKLCSPNEVRRCRPLLGTFAEITASGLARKQLNHATDNAFAIMARVQALMSVHDPASELSRLNREAALHPVRVSVETFTVIRRGLALAEESRGAFDFTIAPILARWGLRDKHLKRSQMNDWRAVRLARNQWISFRSPIALDFGGIAKGYAVDLAVASLREAGVTSATVNAGGDLRVFGSKAIGVHLRHPAMPQQSATCLEISNGALATSSPCFTERLWRGRPVSHLVNPCSDSPVTGAISVSVKAPECWLADALTKVVLNSPETAATLLQKYDAEALVLTS